MEATDHKLGAWVPTVHFLSRLRSSHYHFSFRSKINKYIACCRATWNVFVNLTSQMVLKCGENKIEKDVFRLVTSVGQRKNSESPQRIEPQTFGFRALMLYHWATETLRSVRSIMKFIWHASCILLGSAVWFLMRAQNFFFVPRSLLDEKHLSLFLYRAQNLPSLLFYIQTLRYRHCWSWQYTICVS